MKIRKGGIYKTIDNKDFGIFQASGWEKVIIDIEPKKEKVKVKEPEPVVKEVVEEPKIDELPKSKKKKK